MIAGWEALGGFIVCFVAGGMVVAARTAWRNRWRRGLVSYEACDKKSV